MSRWVDSSGDVNLFGCMTTFLYFLHDMISDEMHILEMLLLLRKKTI